MIAHAFRLLLVLIAAALAPAPAAAAWKGTLARSPSAPGPASSLSSPSFPSSPAGAFCLTVGTAPTVCTDGPGVPVDTGNHGRPAGDRARRHRHRYVPANWIAGAESCVFAAGRAGIVPISCSYVPAHWRWQHPRPVPIGLPTNGRPR